MKDTLFNKKRKRKKKRKEKTLKAHKNSDVDIISSVRKILTRQVQQHQERLSMVTGVGHISGLKASEPQHFWTARVANFVHHFWPYLMSFDSPYEIFSKILMLSSSELQFVSMIFFLLFSLSYLFTNYKEEGGGRREERERNKEKKIKCPRKHTEVPIRYHWYYWKDLD